MSYMTISSQEKHNFSLYSCFHAHPTTLLLKILGGGTNAWAVPPPQFFWGASPPSPTRSLPLLIGYDRHNHTDATFTESSDFNDFSGDPHRCHSREQRSTPSLNLRRPFNDNASMSKADISHRFQ